jgi:hypothetical protein
MEYIKTAEQEAIPEEEVMAAEQDDDDFEFESLHTPHAHQEGRKFPPRLAGAQADRSQDDDWRSLCERIMVVAKAVTVRSHDSHRTSCCHMCTC